MNKNRRLSITERLIKTGLEVGKIQKDQQKTGMHFRVVSHDVVTESIQKVLFSNGIGIIPTQKMVNVGSDVYLDVSIKFVCSDNQKEFIDTNCFVCVKNKTDPREFGSTFSYGVKYILLKTLMLPTGDVDMEYKRAKEDREEEEAKKIPISKFDVARINHDLNEDYIQTLIKWLKVDSVEAITINRLKDVERYIDAYKKKIQNSQNLGVANG